MAAVKTVVEVTKPTQARLRAGIGEVAVSVEVVIGKSLGFRSCHNNEARPAPFQRYSLGFFSCSAFGYLKLPQRRQGTRASEPEPAQTLPGAAP